MDLITKSFGLHHILEKIFMELDQEDLQKCEEVNQIWHNIVSNKSLTWYKKLIQNGGALSKKDESDWTELIDKLICNGDSDQIQYMKEFFHGLSDRIQDPCTLSTISKEICDAIKNGNDDFIKIVAPLIENLNGQYHNSKGLEALEERYIPLHHATAKALKYWNDRLLGYHRVLNPIHINESLLDLHSTYVRMVKILAPLTDELETPFGINPKYNICIGDSIRPDQLADLTPLQAAVKCGNSEIVKILAPLTEKRPDANITYNTLINEAAASGHVDVINALLPLLKEPNPPGTFNNPIQTAARNGHSKVISLFLQFSKDPNAPDSNGMTPIHIAAKHNNLEVISLLLPFCKDPNAPDSNGLTPIHIAANNGSSEIIRILIPYSDNPNAPNPSGWTPIQTAALNGFSNIVKLLAPLTESINAPCPDGFTPLQLASKNGHTDTEEFLIQTLVKKDSISTPANTGEIMDETFFDENVEDEDIEDEDVEDEDDEEDDEEGKVDCS